MLRHYLSLYLIMRALVFNIPSNKLESVNQVFEIKTLTLFFTILINFGCRSKMVSHMILNRSVLKVETL